MSEEVIAARETAVSTAEDAMRRLMAYDWPGNVRELQNAIERAVALGSGPRVAVADLRSNLPYPTTERAPEKDELLLFEELERRAILPTLGHQWGQSGGANTRRWKTTLYPKAEAPSRGDCGLGSTAELRLLRRFVDRHFALLPSRTERFCAFDFGNLSRLHVKNVAVYRNRLGHERMIPDRSNVIKDRLLLILEREPVDVLPRG
jgi:hypothetical protein